MNLMLNPFKLWLCLPLSKLSFDDQLFGCYEQSLDFYCNAIGACKSVILFTLKEASLTYIDRDTVQVSLPPLNAIKVCDLGLSSEASRWQKTADIIGWIKKKLLTYIPECQIYLRELQISNYAGACPQTPLLEGCIVKQHPILALLCSNNCIHNRCCSWSFTVFRYRNFHYHKRKYLDYLLQM